MANTIVLIENTSLKQQGTSFQEHIEQSLKRVVGAKMERTLTLAKAMDWPRRKDCVFAIPVSVPDNFSDINNILKAIRKNLPTPCLFGICFLLIPNKSFQTETLLENAWVNTIDSFYDSAIPVQFIVMHGDSHAVQWFHVSVAMASLFRDLDNLREMERINTTLSNLEARIEVIELQARQH